MEKQKMLKNREKLLKAFAGGATIAMVFYMGHAGATQLKLNQYLQQKANLINKYEDMAPNNTVEYFKANATKQELETYSNLEAKEKASKSTVKDDLTTAGTMFLALGVTGYAALLNSEMAEIDKKEENFKKKEDLKEKEL